MHVNFILSKGKVAMLYNNSYVSKLISMDMYWQFPCKNPWFYHKSPNMFDFRFKTPIPSLNQGRGSVSKVRECAQLIPRIKLPLEGRLLKKFFLIFYPAQSWIFLLWIISGYIRHHKGFFDQNSRLSDWFLICFN